MALRTARREGRTLPRQGFSLDIEGSLHTKLNGGSGPEYPFWTASANCADSAFILLLFILSAL